MGASPFDDFIKAATDLADDAAKGISQVAGDVVKGASGIVDGTGTVLAGAADEAGAALEGAANAAGGALAGAAETIVSATSGAAGAVADTAGSVAGAVGDAAVGVVSTVQANMKEAKDAELERYHASIESTLSSDAAVDLDLIPEVFGHRRRNGAVLFSDYVRPEHRQRWPKAQEVNGITPAMVRDKHTMSELLPVLNEIFSRARVLVAYNLEFDLRFLEAAGVRVSTCAQFDVMKEFAPVADKWDERHGDWRWVKLGQCAGHYGYRFDAHDALEDTRATLHCFNAMLSDDVPGGYLSLVEGSRRRQEESARRREENEAKHRAEEERRERERYERGAEGTLEHLRSEENARIEQALASGDAKRVSKTTYVALAILLGWIGAHEFYAGRTARGVRSVVFCWALVPWVVAIVQAVKMARAKAEPDGSIVVWKKPSHR